MRGDLELAMNFPYLYSPGFQVGSSFFYNIVDVHLSETMYVNVYVCVYIYRFGKFFSLIY